MPTREQIKNDFESYKRLSITERIQLVEDIWDSIEAENPDSFYLSDIKREELHRRKKEHQADPSSGIPWETVRERLFQRPS